jgi:23S rRNA (uracil1939-C5)-methyltransferase
MNENLNTPAIKKGSELELEIESLAYGGMGLARKENFVIFVKGAIPGQKVLAKIYKKKSGFAEARVLTLLTESSNAVEVKCNHYYICSKVQSLSYDEQLKEKSNQVEDAFRRLGGFSNFELSGKVGAEKIFNYRNKMEFTFSPHRWVLDSEPEGVNKSFALGLHMTGRYDKILDIKNCHIQPEIGNKILEVAREVCLLNPDLKPYDPKTHIGFLRYLMIRYGANTDQLMINIVTSYNDLKKYLR